jgi:hypothetical protein
MTEQVQKAMAAQQETVAALADERGDEVVRMARALRAKVESDERELVDTLATFQKTVAEYGVAYALKWKAEDLSTAEFELALHRKMEGVLLQSGSPRIVWVEAREFAIRQLSEHGGRGFEAADQDARRTAAVRALTEATEALDRAEF